MSGNTFAQLQNTIWHH